MSLFILSVCHISAVSCMYMLAKCLWNEEAERKNKRHRYRQGKAEKDNKRVVRKVAF